MAKCILCRQEVSSWSSLFYFSPIDRFTGEKYNCHFGSCSHKFRECGINKKSIEDIIINDARQIVYSCYKSGHITAQEMDIFDNDSINVISKKFFGTSNPTFGFWIEDNCIIVNETLKKILINYNILNFSEIKAYKVFDNAIEYNNQAPTSKEINLNSKNGLRRAIIGGALVGSAGAIVGGLTAKHSLTINEGLRSTYSVKEHNFALVIILNSLSFGGSINLRVGDNEDLLYRFTNILDKITASIG